MSVFVIMWDGYNDSRLQSIWSSRALAEREVERLRKIHVLFDYSIDEIIVDERGE